MKNLDRTLDRALSGRSEPDEDLVDLVETARLLTQAFDLEPQPAFRERALFAAAVGSRRRSGFPLIRVFAPVVAGLGLLAALGFASGSAMPGDALYPVREVLQDVGLNEGVLAEAVARMDEADVMLDEAEDLPGDRRGRATSLAIGAIQELAPVDGLLQEADLGTEELALLRDRLDDLIARGTSLIAGAAKGEGSQEDEDQVGGTPGSTRGAEHDANDDSGPGGGDDDSSGSGSDDDNDNSGPGDGDDSSGSGSGDGDDNDNSGPGDGDDSSGSGSDGDNDSSGSGDRGDNSGSGSDDEPDSSGSGSGEDRSDSDSRLIDSLDDDELDDALDDETESDSEDSRD